MTEPVYAQRYRTSRQLPAGRAAGAYSGQDPSGRPVVVTVVRPQNPAAFLRLMEIVQATRHRNLSAVVEAGQDGADCFVVAEDPGGTDAAALGGEGPQPVIGAALTAATAAAGLAALHRAGAVHGGIDPTQLVRAADGSIKLTGAGVATAFPPADLQPSTLPDVARYLSPEEVAGQAPSQAADVYRLGLVTYLLLTGRHAADGPDARSAAQQQVDGVFMPPHELNPEVPPILSQVVMRALSRDPAARGTAAQFQVEVEQVLRDTRERGAPASPTRLSRVWLWVVTAIIAALAALALAWTLGAFNDDATVPDVTGMTTSRASSVLAEEGLVTGAVSLVASTEGPVGTVVRQEPPAGSEIPEGSAVNLEVADEPTPAATAVAVPNVVGSVQGAAEAQLTAAGFSAAVSQAASDTVPAGTVISQQPQAGVMAAVGSAVAIVVSSGPGASPAASPTPPASPSPGM
jgi:serine/threonine protein kinase